jgi:hypothetical protein
MLAWAIECVIASPTTLHRRDYPESLGALAYVRAESRWTNTRCCGRQDDPTFEASAERVEACDVRARWLRFAGQLNCHRDLGLIIEQLLSPHASSQRTRIKSLVRLTGASRWTLERHAQRVFQLTVADVVKPLALFNAMLHLEPQSNFKRALALQLHCDLRTARAYLVLCGVHDEVPDATALRQVTRRVAAILDHAEVRHRCDNVAQ